MLRVFPPATGQRWWPGRHADDSELKVLPGAVVAAMSMGTRFWACFWLAQAVEYAPWMEVCSEPGSPACGDAVSFLVTLENDLASSISLSSWLLHTTRNPD